MSDQCRCHDSTAEYHIQTEYKTHTAADTYSAEYYRKEMSAFQSGNDTDICKQQLYNGNYKKHHSTDLSGTFGYYAYLMLTGEHCQRKECTRNSEK